MVPDYYARLGVDPDASVPAIESALKKHQPIWSMGTRNPKTRHINQLYLDEVPALRRALLGPPEARAAYDADLAAAQIAQREATLDHLQRRIRLRAAKGGLCAADRALLRDEAGKLGVGDDVLDRLTRLIPALAEGPRHDPGEEPDADPPADVLDSSTRRQIRAALEHLGQRDLYDALGLPRDAPPSIVAARADEERQRWMKKSQVTAEKTAWLEAISHAQSHLTSPRARARYDRTLALEAEEAFDEVAAFTLQGLSRLDLGSRAALIEEAAALGIGPDRADRLITRSCRRARVQRDDGSVRPRAAAQQTSTSAAAAPGGVAAGTNGAYQLLRCRNCSGVTELSPVARRSGPARCRHCGTSLKWDCPVCRRSQWVDQPRCACGFPLALREPLVRHFAAAQHAFRAHDLEQAREHLKQVQTYAPHHVGARNGMARIRQHEADVAYARSAHQLALAGRNLVAARRALETWSKLVDPTLAELRTAWGELTAGLRRAQELAARARRLERSDVPAARDLYLKSLEIAADLPDALAGLNRLPPDVPVKLDLLVLGDRIRLSWTPPAPDGLGPLTFAVVRKRGELPQHPADGTRIAEVSTCEFDDRHVRPGETVSYAVLSKRGGAESRMAVAAGPVLFLPDVQEVRVEPREAEIELSWVPPHGVFEVRVVRKSGGAPAGPRDGERVAASLDHAVDAGLAPNQVYHYSIHAVYRMGDGQRYPSPGVITTAFLRPPVEPPEAPAWSLTASGRVELRWSQPARGAMRILRTSRPFPLPVGSRLNVAEVEHLDGHWIVLEDAERTVDADLPEAGACYYTPLVALGGMLTVGCSAAVSRVGDPSDLRATRTSGASGPVRVSLRWRWAPQAGATRLAARRGAMPSGPEDRAAVTALVAREDYDRAGSWTLELPRYEPDSPPAAGDRDEQGEDASPDAAAGPSGPWYIRAYSVVRTDEADWTSPGVEPTAAIAVPGPHPEITVSYALKRPWFPGRPWRLLLHTEPAGCDVPALVLVVNDRAIPLSADDGRAIAWLPGSKDGATHLVPSSINLARVGVRAFLDPRIDPHSLPPIRLRHPEAGPPRL